MYRRTLALLLACCPAFLRAQAQPVPVTAAKPGWQWSMDSVRAVVNEVRAGSSLQPTTWPGAARVAVLLSFDVDNETIAIRYGEPTVGPLAEMQNGARVGLPRIMRLLGQHKIPTSFFIPSVSLAITPTMADLIKKSGRHEFAIQLNEVTRAFFLFPDGSAGRAGNGQGDEGARGESGGQGGH